MNAGIKTRPLGRRTGDGDAFRLGLETDDHRICGRSGAGHQRQPSSRAANPATSNANCLTISASLCSTIVTPEGDVGCRSKERAAPRLWVGRRYAGSVARTRTDAWLGQDPDKPQDRRPGDDTEDDGESQPLERFVMKATGRDSPCSAVNKLRRIVASTSCEQVRAGAIASAMAGSVGMVVTRDSHPIHIAI